MKQERIAEARRLLGGLEYPHPVTSLSIGSYVKRAEEFNQCAPSLMSEMLKEIESLKIDAEAYRGEQRLKEMLR